MSTVYLMSSVGSIYVGQTDHSHQRSAPSDGETPFAINCPTCEPYLVKDFGAVYKRESVPLTESQVDARAKVEREGNTAVAQAAQALARSALAQTSSPPDIDALVAAAVAKAMAEIPKRGRPRKVAAA